MAISQSRKFFNNRDGVSTPPPTKPYTIIHPEFRPDLRGELQGGHAIRTTSDGKQVVDLTDAQAKYHLDQGSIEPYLGASSAPVGASGASVASPPPQPAAERGKGPS